MARTFRKSCFLADMIIICPSCDARYDLVQAIAPPGRRVRCRKCASIWWVEVPEARVQHVPSPAAPASSDPSWPPQAGAPAVGPKADAQNPPWYTAGPADAPHWPPSPARSPAPAATAPQPVTPPHGAAETPVAPAFPQAGSTTAAIEAEDGATGMLAGVPWPEMSSGAEAGVASAAPTGHLGRDASVSAEPSAPPQPTYPALPPGASAESLAGAPQPSVATETPWPASEPWPTPDANEKPWSFEPPANIPEPPRTPVPPPAPPPVASLGAPSVSAAAMWPEPVGDKPRGPLGAWPDHGRGDRPAAAGPMLSANPPAHRSASPSPTSVAPSLAHAQASPRHTGLPQAVGLQAGAPQPGSREPGARDPGARDPGALEPGALQANGFPASGVQAGMASSASLPGPPRDLPPAPVPRRRSWAAVTASLLVMLATVGLAAFVAVEREAVARAVPGADGLYARLGLAVNPHGLAIRNVKVDWIEEETQQDLEVRGEIHNLLQDERRPPSVVVVVRDRSGASLYHTVAGVGAGVISRGGFTRFTARIPSPPPGTASIAVHFPRPR